MRRVEEVKVHGAAIEAAVESQLQRSRRVAALPVHSTCCGVHQLAVAVWHGPVAGEVAALRWWSSRQGIAVVAAGGYASYPPCKERGAGDQRQAHTHPRAAALHYVAPSAT